MKAKVIKEFEMYGITHKVGEIMNIPLHSPGGLPMISDRDAFLLDNGFIEEMKEPLIKDEKIRKAVRAWAEANEIIKAFVVLNKNMNWIVYGDDIDRNRFMIEFFDRVVSENDETKNYSIEELCGELQNDANM